MAKIIRLTESDLTRIVKRVIMEQQTRIDPPIQLNTKTKKGGITELIILSSWEPHPAGAVFYGYPYGSKTEVKIGFDCNKTPQTGEITVDERGVNEMQLTDTPLNDYAFVFLQGH